MSEEERDALAEKIEAEWESAGAGYFDRTWRWQAEKAADVCLAELSQLRAERELSEGASLIADLGAGPKPYFIESSDMQMNGSVIVRLAPVKEAEGT